MEYYCWRIDVEWRKSEREICCDFFSTNIFSTATKSRRVGVSLESRVSAARTVRLFRTVIFHPRGLSAGRERRGEVNSASIINGNLEEEARETTYSGEEESRAGLRYSQICVRLARDIAIL